MALEMCRSLMPTWSILAANHRLLACLSHSAENTWHLPGALPSMRVSLYNADGFAWNENRAREHSPYLMMTKSMTSMRHQTTLNTKTHYIVCGPASGRLVILLHGLGGSSDTFGPLLPFLPHSTHRIVAVDFEGFGHTPLTDRSTPLSVDRYVSDLDDLIASAQHAQETQGRTSRPVILIGHSLGSVVALHYASMHPENVAGLGLLGVGRSASHIPAARDRMHSLAAKVREEGIATAAQLATQTNFPPGESTPDEAREVVRTAVLASDPEGYAQACEAMISPDHKDPDYRIITCPTVFVSGNDDSISPPDRAREVASLLGGESTVCLVESGHQPILSDLRGTGRAISELLTLVDV